MEYDVRKILELYGGDGNMAVDGLMYWGNMSLKDAIDSVRACGGKVDQEYVEGLRRLRTEPKRAAPSEPDTGSRSGS